MRILQILQISALAIFSLLLAACGVSKKANLESAFSNTAQKQSLTEGQVDALAKANTNALAVANANALIRAEVQYQESIDTIRAIQINARNTLMRMTAQTLASTKVTEQALPKPQDLIESYKLNRIQAQPTSKTSVNEVKTRPNLDKIRAVCKDGSYSSSAAPDACAKNGGVASYYDHSKVKAAK